MEIEEMVVKII